MRPVFCTRPVFAQAHDNYVSSLAGRGGARASLPQRVDSVERMASDSANVAGAQAKELEALRAAHSEHERQEKEVAEGLSQVHAGQAELLERLIAIGSHVDRTATCALCATRGPTSWRL